VETLEAENIKLREALAILRKAVFEVGNTMLTTAKQVEELDK